jgi:Holliday junction resolvase RusA-like endonuclease
MIDVFIKGVPVPQGRPRARGFQSKSGKQCISMYDPSTSRKWKEDVHKQGAGYALENQAKYYEGIALKMELMFYMPRPKSLPKKVKHHMKKPDCDNLAKAVKDGLEGTVSRACSTRTTRKYAT